MTLEETRARLWGHPAGSVCEGLLVLAGSSPLPNLLAVLALRPPKVVAVYSASNLRFKPLFENAVRAYYAPAFEAIDLADPYDPHDVAEQMRRRPLGALVLCYTGGTKPMAVQIHRVWTEQASKRHDLPLVDQRACYLSDASLTLRFDAEAMSVDMASIGVSTAALAKLHGLTNFKSTRQAMQKDDPATDVGLRILDRALDEVGVTARLFLASREKPTPSKADLALRVAIPALEGFPGNAESYRRFIGGVWLEYAAGALVRQAATADDEVLASLWAGVPRAEDFELDLSLRRGARVFAVSVTSDGAEWADHVKAEIKAARLVAEDEAELLRPRNPAKLKLFEVQERARQIGGELARSALICLGRSAWCEELRAEVVREWSGDQHRPAVFGIDHLREWRAGRLDSLRQWFEDDTHAGDHAR